MATPASASCPDLERTREELGSSVGALDARALRRGNVLAEKYRLELQLGEGGMSYVWSAYHLGLEVPVAIKLLKNGARAHRFDERLRIEARAAARLVHPNIVRVLDITGCEAGPFIVLELLSGETLTSRLARGPLRAERAVQLLLPIADALQLAHSHGVIHRDLKPDNVFLAEEGEQIVPKLLDFGIAKLRHAGARGMPLTERGTALGSPSYMSPEQVRGEDVDARSDVWSFCVVLYRALCGKLPFRAASPNAVMDAILSEPPFPLPADGDIDPELARIVAWGLSKDPSARPASMRELGCCLAQWLRKRGAFEDACGTPLTTKWLHGWAAAMPQTPNPRSEDVTVEQPALRSLPRSPLRRSARPASRVSRARRWLLSGTAVLLCVGVSLAASSNGGHAPSAMLLAAEQAPLPQTPVGALASTLTEAGTTRMASPAAPTAPSTAAQNLQRTGPTEARAAAPNNAAPRKARPRAPQLPF